MTFSPPTEWYKDFTKWQTLEKEVKNISTQIRGLLHPVKKFLSSALNRELAGSTGGSYGEWDSIEMACAAAAYGTVTNEWDDDRLRCVVESLNKASSDHGRFPIGRPFHMDNDIGTYQPYNTVVIEAIAEILKESAADSLRLKKPLAIPVEPVLARKLLYFFKDTRADKPSRIEDHGWRFDYMPPPYLTEPLVTAAAVQSLAMINRMLDEQINVRVLYHFYVRYPKDLDKGPDLDTFFYPDYDYGLRQGDESIGQNDSIAILLQKMRAHVDGLRDPDTLGSLVLYGPQGTGKTTIAEALASSCEVPLVEVTPSDIVVGGGEAVERRARTVFEALSLLTRVVILFDEFESVLWKRRPSDDRPSSIFEFLTASMLPKLKVLHKTAGTRSVAYMLITNLIDTLDEPTVRKGRFDKRVGIYPPDLQSRAGRFVSEADAFLSKHVPPHVLPNDTSSKGRLKEVLGEISSGAGMEGLNQEGWFRRPNNEDCLKDGTPLHYYISDGAKPKRLEPDAQQQGILDIVGPVLAKRLARSATAWSFSSNSWAGLSGRFAR